MDLNPWIIALLIAAAAIGIASRFIPGFGPDNPVEQAMEEIIDKETGMEIDLSPDKN